MRYMVALAVVVVTTATAALAGGNPKWSPEYERKVGEEVAAEIMNEYDLVDDKATLDKLQKMADTIALHTPRPDVKYQIRYVKEKKVEGKPEVNAFSLPGGIVFVTEGLVKAVQSDAELAGVLAHEIAHNTHYDGLTQAERANKIIKREMVAVLASVFVGGVDNELWANVMKAGMYYRQGVLGGYSKQMEKAADCSAVDYLCDTPWTPVGLLTFMERLAAEELHDPPPTMGVFQTHPLSIDRVEYLMGKLRQHDISINRRLTSNWEKPVVEEGEVNGKPAQIVKFRGERIFACDQPANGAKDAKDRAQRIAANLTKALGEGAQLFHFRVIKQNGKPTIVAFADTLLILTVEKADADLVGTPPDQVAQTTMRGIRNGLARENLARLLVSS